MKELKVLKSFVENELENLRGLIDEAERLTKEKGIEYRHKSRRLAST